MSLRERLREDWRRFKDHEPGRRFEERYQQRHEKRTHRLAPSRVLPVVGGLALIAVGLLMLVAPGPGLAAIFLGLGLIGSEFRPVARLMDHLEVRLRRLWEWAKHFWHGASLVARGLVVLLALAATAAFAFGCYRLFFPNGLF